MISHERRNFNEFLAQPKKAGIKIRISEQHGVPGASEMYVRNWLAARNRLPSGPINGYVHIQDGTIVRPGFYAKAGVTTEELLEHTGLLEAYANMYRDALLEANHLKRNEELGITSLGDFEGQLVLRLNVIDQPPGKFRR